MGDLGQKAIKKTGIDTLPTQEEVQKELTYHQ
jgi:hypothetical protein